mmetsp:Transcript_117915/g.165769  ORF Transcript_117915/g.165769 Transcript_117915/m.165769 type:complete len:308 (+) Transcript_117915:222-1145(+)
MGELEDSSSGNSSDKFQHGVDEGLEEKTSIEDVGRGNAERHGRVQGATRDATDGEATHSDAGTDGQAKQMRGLGAFRHGHAQDHKAQDKGVDDLRHRDTSPGAGTNRAQGKGAALVDESIRKSCGNATSNLNTSIGASLGWSQISTTARGQDSDCHGWVEMGSAHIAQSINHRSEASSNRERSSLGLSQDVQTHSKDQHVGSQEFTDQFCDLRFLATKVFWTHHLEESSRHGSTNQLEGNVDKAPTKAQSSAGQVNAQGNRRVEATTRNGTSAISTCHHGECDGHAIVLVLLSCILLGRGNIHHHKC